MSVSQSDSVRQIQSESEWKCFLMVCCKQVENARRMVILLPVLTVAADTNGGQCLPAKRGIIFNVNDLWRKEPSPRCRLVRVKKKGKEVRG